MRTARLPLSRPLVVDNIGGNGSMTNRSEDEPAKFSSPACSMPEADDAYMGYAGKAELATFLSELLEAERAGSRVTLQSARAASSGPVANLMRTIQRDEVRWCAMLTRHLKALGETPSTKSAPSTTRQWPSPISPRASPFSIAARAGWCENCARCCLACAMTGYTPISPKCCKCTRRKSHSPTTSCTPGSHERSTVPCSRRRLFRDGREIAPTAAKK